MRSQEIKIRNLQPQETKPKSIRVKPVEILGGIIVLGVFFIFSQNMMTSAGMALILLGLTALILMPDRILAQFTPEYMILYNNKSRDTCFLAYWDEIVQWQYEWHATSDELVITLLDGSSQIVEMYSKRSIAKYLNQYIPGKEVKYVKKDKGVGK